jgi:hypothetical protein
VAGEVELGGLVVAEDDEEGEDDNGIVAALAGGGESPLVSVLPPVDGDLAGAG